MHEARHWHTDEGQVVCDLCPQGCRLGEGQFGRCHVRQACGGRLYAAGYGHVSAVHVDPIEKKPLHHFHPGAVILSIGGWGCNLACRFCQNWSISQRFESDAGPALTPEAVARQADRDGSIGVAYTYNEPLVGFEFVYDCAAAVRARGLANVLVTNGFIRPEPAAELLPRIDALNIDIKGFREAFYRESCGGQLQPILDFAVQAVRAGCHVEITNLVIPGLNDDPVETAELAGWIRRELGAGVPLHLSAYRPEYKSRIPATPYAALRAAYAAARGELAYVYLGNVAGPEGTSTTCTGCGAVLIERHGYTVRVTGLNPDGCCRACGKNWEIRNPEFGVRN